MLFGLPWNGCMVRETDLLVFLIMCSLQRESIFALPSLTGLTLKILISALKKLEIVKNTSIRTCCHGGNVTERNMHFCQREWYYSISFVKWASSALKLKKPFTSTRMSSKNMMLKTLRLCMSDFMTLSPQFFLGPALSSSCSFCVFTPLGWCHLTASGTPCLFLPWVILVLPVHLIRT